MWNLATINERTKDVIFLYASQATGKIGEKPKAGVLFQLKGCLLWWIMRFVKGFDTVSSEWHSYNTAAIHKAAHTYKFETAWLKKNNLTDAELSLFWAVIEKPQASMTNLENWKQHYVAWVMMWVTSARPGSLTVGYGYEAGSPIAQDQLRSDDETLRWKDLEFFRVPSESGGGIGIKGIFRWQKGLRIPHQQKRKSPDRRFTILPLHANRYHLDLALLLTSLAFSRGLFHYKSLWELFNGDEVNIQQVGAVSKEAVFLAYDQAGVSPAHKPMHENSLNPKLREMCDLVGLFDRNTVYAFRRGAIVDQRRKMGTESAKEVAGHDQQSQTIYFYDDKCMEDVDLANLRVGSKVHDRAYIRDLFSQANSSRFTLDQAGTAANPGGVAGPRTSSQGDMIKKAAIEMANTHPETLERMEAVELAFHQGRQQVISKGVHASLMIHNMDVVDHLIAQIKKGQTDCEPALTAIETAKDDLRLSKRRLRRSAKKDLRDIYLEEAKTSQRLAKTGHRAGSKGRSTDMERTAIRDATGTDVFDRDVDELETYDPTDDDDDDDEEEVEQEDLDADGVDQSDPWSGAAEGARITFADEQQDPVDTAATTASRIEFAQKFLDVSSRPNKDLRCIQCALDPTVPYDKKKLRYTHSKLDHHLKGNYHDREKQIMRAFHIDEIGTPPKAVCPVCHKSFVAKGFIKHIMGDHSDQLLF